MRKVCVVSSSRADLHLMRGMIEELHASKTIELQLVLTGMHMSGEFGRTQQAIHDWGIPASRSIEMLVHGDSRVGASKALGVGVISFADALEELGPDIVVLMGDRYELLAPAMAALIQRIPLAHIHGGEKTVGAMDDSIRHALTKLSCLHFVAADEYRKRVIQLGEDPSHVYFVGGLGVDSIKRSHLLEKADLEGRLGVALDGRSALVSFHPVTLDRVPSTAQLRALLGALDDLDLSAIILTAANADPGGRELNEMMINFARERERATFVHSLGDPWFASVIQAVGVVVGNSSSGLLEAPTLGTPTVNVGNRQEGRLRADSVIDCEPTRQAIVKAVERALSPEFRASIRSVSNPYGQGGASAEIVRTLEAVDLEGITMKRFHDSPG